MTAPRSSPVEVAAFLPALLVRGSQLEVMDLFSGIGGFSLGLERTGGFRTTSFCEIDPYCRKVLAKNWPDVPIHEDVTKREYTEGEADVITAGFPCQDISLAGKGAGITGERSGLWREVVRAVRMVRPRYVILENVAALLGRGLGDVQADLAEIGYDCEWDCIPASAVGAPHRRDRWWGVAYAQRHALRDEPGRRNGQNRASQAKLRYDGSEGSVAHSNAECQLQSQGCLSHIGRWPGNGGEELAHSNSTRQSDNQGWPETEEFLGDRAFSGSGWRIREDEHWRTEPDVGRVAHGIPSRVDRLRGLGNAVVPQIQELIGRAILESR